MKDFRDKLAVITGGGTGMGRELARQLTAEGCHVAMCDVLSENLAETKRLCDERAPAGVRVTIHACDVSKEAEVNAFRDAVQAAAMRILRRVGMTVSARHEVGAADGHEVVGSRHRLFGRFRGAAVPEERLEPERRLRVTALRSEAVALRNQGLPQFHRRQVLLFRQQGNAFLLRIGRNESVGKVRRR